MMGISPKKPITVLQLVLSLCIGGTEKIVYDLVRRMKEAGIRPLVCCLDEIGEFGEMLRHEEGIPIESLQRKPGLDYPLFSRIADRIEDLEPDILHAHHYSPFFYGLFGALLARRRRKGPMPRLVFTEHGIEYPFRRRWKRCLLNPLLLRMADEVTTIARHTRNNLAKYENYPPDRVRVLYNGIDVGAYSGGKSREAARDFLGLSPRNQIIGVVARLDPVKNHPMLLRAFREVSDRFPGTRLMIIGEGPARTDIEALVDRMQLRSRVLFLGARRDVADIIRAMDIFALPSFSEGMSVTLLEAMAAELPVVATRVGGNDEVVVDGETGFLVPDDDARTMANRLMALLENDRLRRKMGSAGRKRVEAVFSVERMVDRYAALYEGTLRRFVVEAARKEER